MPEPESIVVGRQPVLEALRSGTAVEKIVIQRGAHGAPIEAIRSLANQLGIPLTEASKDRLEELAGQTLAQGVLAYLAHAKGFDIDDIIRVATERNEPPLILILDEIEDPHNVGALLRTAECAGAHGAILLKHHSPPLGSAVAKASAGASLHLPLARVANLAQAIDRLKESGLWVIGTDASAPATIYEHDLSGPVALVVGNEGRGMRRLVKEKCDVLLKIPLYGRIQSLNASVAGALVMFEAARARRQLQR